MSDTPRQRSQASLLVSRRECLALPLLVATSENAFAQQRGGGDKPYARLSADSTIGDLISHLAFEGSVPIAQRIDKH